MKKISDVSIFKYNKPPEISYNEITGCGIDNRVISDRPVGLALVLVSGFRSPCLLDLD